MELSIWEIITCVLALIGMLLTKNEVVFYSGGTLVLLIALSKVYDLCIGDPIKEGEEDD